MPTPKGNRIEKSHRSRRYCFARATNQCGTIPQSPLHYGGLRNLPLFGPVRMEVAMSNWPFRFIHASDFHLERPLMGVAEVPDHLRDLFLESPYTAARQVFEAALVEDVKFVVLSGGIVHAVGFRPSGAAVPGRTVYAACRTGDRGLLGRLGDRSAGGLARGRPAAAKRPYLSARPGRGMLVQSRRRAAGAGGGRELR